ncbi:MAG: response regulator [Acidobacteria bacterium]|nr:response regulator [Acidobacteriota bacterium]
MCAPRILIVEDEKIVAADIEECLTEAGYTVRGAAASGLEALKRIVETDPDLVLMDIKLKGPLDGVDVAEAICMHLDIPVVYLTAYADGETLERAKRTGPAGYVLKPFDGRRLRTAVELALCRSRDENHERRRQRRLADALRSLADAVILAETTGAVVFLNPAAERLTGWPQSEACGRYVEEVFVTLHRDTGAPLRPPVARVHFERAAVPLDSRAVLVARGGTRTRIRGSAQPVRDEDGCLTAVAFVFRETGAEQ